MSGEYIYSGGFWDSKACAVCARWDRSGAAAPNSAPKIVWQFLEPSLVLLQQSTDQSEKSCEDNLPVSSNISKPNSAPKRCDRIGSASVATWYIYYIIYYKYQASFCICDIDVTKCYWTIKINDFIYFAPHNLWPICAWKLDERRCCKYLYLSLSGWLSSISGVSVSDGYCLLTHLCLSLYWLWKVIAWYIIFCPHNTTQDKIN